MYQTLQLRINDSTYETKKVLSDKFGEIDEKRHSVSFEVEAVSGIERKTLKYHDISTSTICHLNSGACEIRIPKSWCEPLCGDPAVIHIDIVDGNIITKLSGAPLTDRWSELVLYICVNIASSGMSGLAVREEYLSAIFDTVSVSQFCNKTTEEGHEIILTSYIAGVPTRTTSCMVKELDDKGASPIIDTEVDILFRQTREHIRQLERARMVHARKAFQGTDAEFMTAFSEKYKAL